MTQLNQTAEIEGCITIPFPFKEIHKTEHKPMQIRTLVGNRSIVYFGEIEFSIYIIHAEDFSLRLIRDKLRYKGFAFFEEHEFPKKPIVEIKTLILDTFPEIKHDSVKITGIISTELTLSEQREISLEELQCFLSEHDIDGFQPEEAPVKPSSSLRGYSEFQEFDPDITLEFTTKNGTHSSSEVRTEVYPGTNSDLILTLED